MNRISVVVTALNDEKNIKRVLKSVAWADEIVVCDLGSDDKTTSLAKELGANVVSHQKVDYVELVRNWTVDQAKHEWVLILDPDEEVSDTLADKLREVANNSDNISFVEITRQNIIFGKWMKAAMWWPDYNIRFFKKGSVSWGNEIHRPPVTTGDGIKLSDSKDLAIIHHHYEGVSQFITRLDRYTTAQAEGLKKEDYKFFWGDLILKPLNEFLSRYFANAGYKDGLHGFALSLLQAFSFLVMYLKAWEAEGFKQEDLQLKEVEAVSRKAGHDLKYWFGQSMLSGNPLKKFYQKARQKIL